MKKSTKKKHPLRDKIISIASADGWWSCYEFNKKGKPIDASKVSNWALTASGEIRGMGITYRDDASELIGFLDNDKPVFYRYLPLESYVD